MEKKGEGRSGKDRGKGREHKEGNLKERKVDYSKERKEERGRQFKLCLL